MAPIIVKYGCNSILPDKTTIKLGMWAACFVNLQKKFHACRFKKI